MVLKLQQTFWNMEHDLLLLRINISDELLCKRNEPMAAIGRLHFQKCVSC